MTDLRGRALMLQKGREREESHNSSHHRHRHRHPRLTSSEGARDVCLCRPFPRLSGQDKDKGIDRVLFPRRSTSSSSFEHPLRNIFFHSSKALLSREKSTCRARVRTVRPTSKMTNDFECKFMYEKWNEISPYASLAARHFSCIGQKF